VKTRQGFVSNSSSSSFVVIGSREPKSTIPLLENGAVCVGPRVGGEYEFGWEIEDHTDTYSRINFAYIQAKDTNNEYWLETIEEAIKEVTGAADIIWCEFGSNKWTPYGYIDHQSSACEGENTEMFESIDSMKRFLFSSDSYIHTDNDNH